MRSQTLRISLTTVLVLVKSWLRSAWVFPALLLIPLIFLSANGISGTSIGFFDQLNNGKNENESLLFGEYRPVRSDEWLFNTPSLLAQSNLGWPRINPTIGLGQDTSVVLDVPYKDWSIIFRPQNLPFFFLPLESAFALKWWGLLFALLVAAYFFALELVPGKRLFAALASSTLGISPFVFWWYQTATIAPLVYSLLLALVFMRVLRTKKISSQTGLGIITAYLLVSFALVLYPPFQIACGLVLAFFCLGYLLEYHSKAKSWPIRQLGIMVVSGLLAIAVIALFVFTRMDVVQALVNTSYPGDRSVMSGGYDWRLLFSGFLNFQLQNWDVARFYNLNQSEASSFIIIAPFLLIPSAYLLVARFRQSRALDWPLLLVNLLLVLLLFRLFLPHLNWFYHWLLLDKVPHQRLIIAMGLLGFVQLVLFFRRLQDRPVAKAKLISIATGIIAAICLLRAGMELHWLYPQFLPSMKMVIALAIITALASLLISDSKTIYYGLGIMVILSIYSCYRILPLYKGLAPLNNSPLTAAIADIDRGDPGVWASVDDRMLVTMPLVANVRSYTGIYSYPQLYLWKTVDPKLEFAGIYNRFAHAIGSTQQQEPFTLGADDYFLFNIDPCQNQLNIKYLLSSSPLERPCVSKIQMIRLDKSSYYIYRITNK